MTDFTIEATNIQKLWPDALQEIGKFTYKAKGAGDAQPGVGKYMVIWRKDGDTWKVGADIWNEDK
jgi:ketosteroid isomerase-like protein